jgi:hypothetical protein
MRKFATFALVGLLALATVVAFAQGPTVTTPKEGDRVGPNIDVAGNLGHRGLIVIVTDAYRSDTNAKISSVPGIRHYTKDDGSFAFRVATPRRASDINASVVYKVRVYEMKGPDNPGPETVITCTAENK